MQTVASGAGQLRRAPRWIVALLLFAPRAWAHGGEGHAEMAWWKLWPHEPTMDVALVLTLGVYLYGLHRLRVATRVPTKLRRAAWCFIGGWIALAIALVSPLHPWGQLLFSAHMTQHEVLMLVAAPLLVLGQPGLVTLWVLSRGGARAVTTWINRIHVQRVWELFTLPLVAWAVHAIALWIWHVPALFEATLSHPWVHDVQHASFFFSALLFWQALFHGARREKAYGIGLLYLFTTAVHSGALGALITFATRVWYPHYLHTAPEVGLTAIEDQQIGGLIMWIPAGLVYIGAALIMFAASLRRAPAPMSSGSVASSDREGRADSDTYQVVDSRVTGGGRPQYPTARSRP